MQPIYLDHNATTPVLAEVLAAMAECYESAYGNPSSQHRLGQRARRLVEDAREEIAALLGADTSRGSPDRLIFTSGGTESNNLAVFGLSGAAPATLAISTIEHPSVSGPAEALQQRGWTLERIAVTADGAVCLDDFQRVIETTPDLRLVSVMLGNNETGVLQPVAELTALAKRRDGICVHTDAVQVSGKLPIHFRSLGVDALSIAAHKFHGPRGIRALIVRPHVALHPQLHGGFQQQGLRPGTEPVALIVGMQRALALWHAEQQERGQRMTALRDRLEAQLRHAWPTLIVHGAGAERLPHTSCVSFPGLDRQALVLALDLAGVACSTGSACASGSSEPSVTLRAMNSGDDLIASAVRFSLGARTTQAEIDDAASRIIRICNDLQTSGSGQKTGLPARQQRSKTL